MTLRRGRWLTRAFACAALAATAPLVALADDAAAPAWLRAPYARGPAAVTAAFDDQHVWWGLDGMLPLSVGLPSLTGNALATPSLGLGLSVMGRDIDGARDLRYTALLDRRSSEAGGWLGLSTGGRDHPNARVSLGTGLWRSFAPIQVEAGVVSSIVATQEPVADHWGFFRDSLHWRDTTTFRLIDRSRLRSLAQTTLRWQAGRVEVAAIGGLTFGPAGRPQRWAQATLDVQASRRVLLIAALGQRPGPSLAFDASARPRTMLGVQVAPWAGHDWAMARAVVPKPRAWMTRSLAPGQTAMLVWCPGATRVEITGDFTEWNAIALSPLGSGWWGNNCGIAPGLHNVQVRVDGGAWLVPPGLRVTQGEFAGAAGVLLIE